MKAILIALLFCFCCSAVCFAAADTVAKAKTTDTVVKKFDIEGATQAYLNTMSAKDKASSDAYFEGGYWLILWNFVYDAAVVALIYYLGIAGWLKARVSKISKNDKVQNYLFALGYMLISFVLSFPMGVYTGFFREHQYNLSNQTFGAWFNEGLISFAISAIFGSLAFMVFYIVIKRTAQNWWKWCAGVAVLFAVLIMMLAPVYISPLFNKYSSLSDKKVKESILSLARANNVPATDVYEFDASKQSDRISANVSGFAGTTRVSLNDNLLKKCSPEEVKAVMGHELGHYVLNHVYKGLMEIMIIIFVGFAFTNWAFQKLRGKKLFASQITGTADIAGLPLLILTFSFFMFLATPVLNSMTRTQEIEADIFGLNTARQPDAFAKVAMKLSNYRKINPGYWEEIIFFDHPSGRNRVLSSMRWKAEHLNDCDFKKP